MSKKKGTALLRHAVQDTLESSTRLPKSRILKKSTEKLQGRCMATENCQVLSQSTKSPHDPTKDNNFMSLVMTVLLVATFDLMTGPSCLGSPESTTLVRISTIVLIDANVSGSVACPGSSIEICVNNPLSRPIP
jgi:DMSO reductase anchor subunit